MSGDDAAELLAKLAKSEKKNQKLLTAIVSS